MKNPFTNAKKIASLKLKIAMLKEKAFQVLVSQIGYYDSKAELYLNYDLFYQESFDFLYQDKETTLSEIGLMKPIFDKMIKLSDAYYKITRIPS